MLLKRFVLNVHNSYLKLKFILIELNIKTWIQKKKQNEELNFKVKYLETSYIFFGWCTITPNSFTQLYLGLF